PRLHHRQQRRLRQPRWHRRPRHHRRQRHPRRQRGRPPVCPHRTPGDDVRRLRRLPRRPPLLHRQRAQPDRQPERRRPPPRRDPPRSDHPPAGGLPRTPPQPPAPRGSRRRVEAPRRELPPAGGDGRLHRRQQARHHPRHGPSPPQRRPLAPERPQRRARGAVNSPPTPLPSPLMSITDGAPTAPPPPAAT